MKLTPADPVEAARLRLIFSACQLACGEEMTSRVTDEQVKATIQNHVEECEDALLQAARDYYKAVTYSPNVKGDS